MQQQLVLCLIILLGFLHLAHCSPDLSGIRAIGNKLVNSKNEPVNIRVRVIMCKQKIACVYNFYKLSCIILIQGLNHAGTEYACVQGYAIFEKPYNQTLVDSFKAWKANAVRVPLNEDCWLGINGVKPEFSGQNYINNISEYVNMFTREGFVVILDLHWTAPGTQKATKQVPMPDQDHSIAFWTSVASTFSNNDKVIFELFNEPYPDHGNWNSDEGWKCWRDGGYCNGVGYKVCQYGYRYICMCAYKLFTLMYKIYSL